MYDNMLQYVADALYRFSSKKDNSIVSKLYIFKVWHQTKKSISLGLDKLNLKSREKEKASSDIKLFA